MPRRLIGIDLAWGERAGTGCAERAWRGDELELLRLDVLGPLDEIVGLDRAAARRLGGRG